MATVYTGNIPSGTAFEFEDPGDLESEESMDPTCADDLAIYYDDEKIEELQKKISTLTEQLQELQTHSELLESQKDSLSQEVQELKDEIDELRGQLKEEHKLTTSLQKRVKELETQVDRLKHEIISYKCDEDKVYFCQVAVEFERALCSHVLPEVFSRNKSSSNAKLDRLLNMLNSGDEGLIPQFIRNKYDIKAVLSGAHQRWDKVCDDLQLPPEWKTITGKEIADFTHGSVPRIFRAMAVLKEERNPVAHPNPVSLQVAEQKLKATSIQKDMEEWEFDLVEEFILSLRASMRKSGIQTSQSRFKL